jgi:hypothetical protein
MNLFSRSPDETSGSLNPLGMPSFLRYGHKTLCLYFIRIYRLTCIFNGPTQDVQPTTYGQFITNFSCLSIFDNEIEQYHHDVALR